MTFFLESWNERFKEWLVIGTFATKSAARARASELHLTWWRVRES